MSNRESPDMAPTKEKFGQITCHFECASADNFLTNLIVGQIMQIQYNTMTKRDLVWWTLEHCKNRALWYAMIGLKESEKAQMPLNNCKNVKWNVKC